MYVQIDSDNGGIVVNLGIEGVAFQAGKKLTAERNSTINLRLRGSGLNVDLIGELVWLGATQREAGICFKNLSTSVRKEIADWIARDSQLFENVALEGWTRPQPKPKAPQISPKTENTASQSIPAASDMPQTIPAAPPSSAGADESSLPASSDSGRGKSLAAAPPEIASPVQQFNDPAEELIDRPQEHHAVILALPDHRKVEPPVSEQPYPGQITVEPSGQSPARNSFPILPFKEATPRVQEEQTRASTEPSGIHKSNESEVAETGPRDPPPQSPRNSLETMAERWVPPAILAAWNRGNQHYKILLASLAVACVLFFALILILAMAQIESSLGGSVASGSPRQSSAPPAASSVIAGAAQPGSLQSPPAPPVTVRPRSHQPPASLLTSLGEIVFGYEPRTPTGIDPDQIGVQVWTSKSSGYYYCPDSSFYKTIQDGAFMSQGTALQSGYRPKLGQFCD